MSTVDVRLLGGVEVVLDGVLADAGYPRQRCVLAALAVEAGRAVSPEALIDRVWGERPPRSATGSLQAYVTRLRKLFADTGVTITRRAGGYVLQADPDVIDLHRFRELVARAHDSHDQTAGALYDAAFALWRGEPFTGMDTEWFAAVRTGLEAEFHRVRLDHNDVLLRTGGHGELLDHLPTTVRARPLDERLVGQLMQALHLSGRQADALAEYERLRVRLAEELGNDPGPDLRAVYRRVIVGDKAGPQPPSAEAVPRQVPAAPRLFTGRDSELSALDSDLESAPVWVIAGPGGIGKTWLALHWANRQRKRFGDGQLYVDLRGFHPREQPLEAGTALGRILESLGVAPSAIPGDTEARAARYRSALAGKRMLVVLDNARDAAQVSPLLPGGGDCTTIVTSRHNLPGLRAAQGARLLQLDTWDDHTSRRAIAGHIGMPRLAEHPDVAAELIGHCGGLPLALGILGARAAAQPKIPLRVLADELRDSTDRLDTLDDDGLDIGLRAVFDGSYRALESEQARLFALFGIVPTSDIAVHAVASLAGRSMARTRKLLRALESTNLVQQHEPGRYRVHDLVRLYAAERAESDLDAEDRSAADLRLIDHYLHTVAAADRWHLPHRDRTGEDLSPPAAGCLSTPLDDAPEAHEWFARHHDAVRAAQVAAVNRGDQLRVWQLTWHSQMMFGAQARYTDLVALWRIGLEAAQRLGDADRQAVGTGFLGIMLLHAGQESEAVELLQRAVSDCERRELSDHSRFLHELAHWHAANGDPATGVAYCDRGLRSLGPDADIPRAALLNSSGLMSLWHGDVPQARRRCTAAVELLREKTPESLVLASALDSLGQIAQHEGDHAAVKRHLKEAIDMFATRRSDEQLAWSLERLGDTHAALREHDRAREVWTRALRRYESADMHAQADGVAAKLAFLPGFGVPQTMETAGDPRNE